MFIIGELNIEIPEIPERNVSEFLDYSKDYHILHGHSKEEDRYFARNNRKYPWYRRVLEYKGTKFYDYENWFNISKILNSIPILQKDRTIILLHQNEQLEYDFNFHFDNDAPIGYRLCYGLNTTKKFLELSKIKQEYKDHALQLNKIEPFMLYDKIYSIVPIKSNTLIRLNGEDYPHRVPVENNKCRTVFVIYGKNFKEISIEYLQKLNYVSSS